MYLFIFLSLMIVIGVAIWAFHPAARRREAMARRDLGDFSLNDAVLLIGPDVEAVHCGSQRAAIKAVLPALLDAGYRVIELYGEHPPAQNGRPLSWLDNQLLRDTLHAERGFHLIFIGRRGQMLFHATRPVAAAALAELLDLRPVPARHTGPTETNEKTSGAPAGLQEMARSPRPGSLIGKKSSKPALRARRGHAAKTQSVLPPPRSAADRGTAAQPSPPPERRVTPYVETTRPPIPPFSQRLAETLCDPDPLLRLGAVPPRRPAQAQMTPSPADPGADPAPAPPLTAPERRAPSHVIARLRRRRGF